MSTKKTEKVKKDTPSVYEEEAEKFSPAQGGCGALLKAKRSLTHVMKLKDASQANIDEGDMAIVLYDFRHEETGERAMVLLMGESRFMYMTTEFDEDFEVVRMGTSQMQFGEPNEKIAKLYDNVSELDKK